MPETRKGSAVKKLGESGITLATEGGSCSLILIGAGISYSGNRIELDIFHEVFGHGIPIGLKLSGKISAQNAIKLENLTRRVLGIKEYRTGVNHGGGKVENPESLPLIYELK